MFNRVCYSRKDTIIATLTSSHYLPDRVLTHSREVSTLAPVQVRMLGCERAVSTGHGTRPSGAGKNVYTARHKDSRKRLIPISLGLNEHLSSSSEPSQPTAPGTVGFSFIRPSLQGSED